MTLQEQRKFRIQALLDYIKDWPDFKESLVARFGLDYGVSRRMTLEYIEILKSGGRVIESEDHILKLPEVKNDLRTLP